MGNDGIYNDALEKIKNRIGNVSGKISKDFKGVRPFNKEVVSSREKLLQYSQFTPQVEQMSRQQFGDYVVDNYKLKMETLARKYNG